MTELIQVFQFNIENVRFGRIYLLLFYSFINIRLYSLKDVSIRVNVIIWIYLMINITEKINPVYLFYTYHKLGYHK